MKNGKRILALILTAGMVLGTGVLTSMASDKKITSISLDISADITVGSEMGSGEVEVTTNSSNYSVDEYEFTNSGFNWSEDDVPKLEIRLYAEDGYYFSVDPARVKLKGAGATYVSKKNEDSSHTLVLTISLMPLDRFVNTVENVQLNTNGWATWAETAGAGSYEIYLYRDSRAVGGSRTTQGTSLNLGGSMNRAGSYTIKVRGIGRADAEIKGDWTDSSSCYIDEAQAVVLKNAAASGSATIGSWQQDHVGWWYRNADGSYPQNNWLLVSDKWYFFYANGYMATGWIPWGGKWYYCNASGDMAVNTTVDGYSIGADGARIDP